MQRKRNGGCGKRFAAFSLPLYAARRLAGGKVQMPVASRLSRVRKAVERALADRASADFAFRVQPLHFGSGNVRLTPAASAAQPPNTRVSVLDRLVLKNLGGTYRQNSLWMFDRSGRDVA
jgi:hypothetical protein